MTTKDTEELGNMKPKVSKTIVLEAQQSYCVSDPEIEEVLDMGTGEYHRAQTIIGNEYEVVEQLRMRLAESIAKDSPIYACSLCGVGVYLVCRRSNDEKRFYFRHRVEDGSCPSVTRGQLTESEMNARKYNGQKESFAHRRMKEIVAESLRCDANFSDVTVEKVWKGQDRKSWRKPDVRAVWRDATPVAFEIQLSTTYLHVIAERRLFYLKEGGLLCWVFQKFDVAAARMTQDDVFFNNNQNLFLVSEDTLTQSKQQQALVLDCHWTEPTLDESRRVVEVWHGRHVKFLDLTMDIPQQKVYLVDYSDTRKQLMAETAVGRLRDSFEKWWCHYDWPPSDEKWETFRKEFELNGVQIPKYPLSSRGLLNSLYSAKAGTPVGYRNKKFISVAHNVADNHKNILQFFRAALLVYGRGQQLEEEDSLKLGQSKGKWALKVAAYKAQIMRGDTDYQRDRTFDSLVALLFPEVWEQVKIWDAKQLVHN